MGIEFTWLPKSRWTSIARREAWGGDMQHAQDEILSQAKYDLETLVRRHQLPIFEPVHGIHGFKTRVHTDDGAVETPTPPLFSWKQVERWWTKALRLTQQVNLVPWKPRDMSGGAHHHMSLFKVRDQNIIPAFAWNLIALVYEHPELNWIFNDPYDKKTANWVGLRFNAHKIDPREGAQAAAIRAALRNSIPYPRVTRDMFEAAKPDEWLDGKDYAIRFDIFKGARTDDFLPAYDTVEFRFYDMPRCVKDLKLQVDFSQALFDHVRSVSRRLDSHIRARLTYEKFRQLSKDTSAIVKNFETLVESIGLDPYAYRKFYSRNLYPRLRLGKEYMV
jgi:hypothetical protein